MYIFPLKAEQRNMDHLAGAALGRLADILSNARLLGALIAAEGWDPVKS